MLNMFILSIVVATAATVVTSDRSTKVGGRGLRGRLPWLRVVSQSGAGQGRAGPSPILAHTSPTLTRNRMVLTPKEKSH